jgi:uncharacterized protein (DUF4415 family)
MKHNPALLDDDNPEWTAVEGAKANRFSGLAESLQNKLARRGLGTQVASTKTRITIQLSKNVVDSFRATGEGWQTRMDAALQDWLKSHTAPPTV